MDYSNPRESSLRCRVAANIATFVNILGRQYSSEQGVNPLE
ncbi:hypothetical protein yinte0001_990 [Yersinia intermedia ATCC 29909]|nr:hypothetical protein yinte0001_990 [Yersinia intermedia ATCC 29909]